MPGLSQSGCLKGVVMAKYWFKQCCKRLFFFSEHIILSEPYQNGKVNFIMTRHSLPELTLMTKQKNYRYYLAFTILQKNMLQP